MLVLHDARSRVGIVPEQGGGIAFMEALLPGGLTAPVLRPWTGEAADGPFALGCNILVPFSNRIAGGGFACGGTFHAVAPNLAGEPLPIHGDGFQRAWAVESADETGASLLLPDGAIGPFRYEARLDFRLHEGALVVALALTSRAPLPLPYGAGFHPWFPRRNGTALRFAASGVWLEDERHLPTERRTLAGRPQWDFSQGRALPEGWINNAFTGWPGTAEIAQPELGIRIGIEASPDLDVAIVYSPGREADFFCFEPVSHAVDAHNRPGHPGLAMLAWGRRLTAGMTLRWSPLDA